MFIIQFREVGFVKEEARSPLLAAGETFGDNSVLDVSWQKFGSYETAFDALADFVSSLNAEEIDDVNNYYRVVNSETGEIGGI